jgi:dipeptidyl aminopeptidase/acylaminoacyl peptidase
VGYVPSGHYSLVTIPRRQIAGLRRQAFPSDERSDVVLIKGMTTFKRIGITSLAVLLVAVGSVTAHHAYEQQPPAARVVDLKASDGTILKASYFAAAKPGPAVLLLHQGNRTRHSWDDLAEQLAAAGINTLTLDMRGYGESGGKHQNWPRGDSPVKKIWADDIDAAWKYLTSHRE